MYVNINEILTFKRLLSYSSNRRKGRAPDVKYKTPPNFASGEDTDQYIFSTKSNPSTTGKTFDTSVVFFKPRNPKLPLERCKCKVDCSCPDYKFTYAYANKKTGSSDIGMNSLNKCINKPPRITNPRQRTGMCKHLIALNDYVEGELYSMPAEMDTKSKLDTLSSKYKKPLKPLPGAERRKAEMDKIRGIKESVIEYKDFFNYLKQ